MKTILSVTACLLTLLSPIALVAEGIPEPGIVFYGNVTNAGRALRVGQLTLEISGPGASVVQVTAHLTNAGPYAYRVRVPYESLVGGNTLSANAFSLTPYTSTVRVRAPAQYAQSATNKHDAVFRDSDNAEYPLSGSVRALVRELNFSVDSKLPSAGPIRLTEARLVRRDSGEGNPSDAPVFQFTSIASTQQPGILVEWTGAPVNRGYYLLRSATMAAGLSEYEVLRWFEPSPVTAHSFWDTNMVNTATSFYQLLAQ